MRLPWAGPSFSREDSETRMMNLIMEFLALEKNGIGEDNVVPEPQTVTVQILLPE